jgi:uncharacterized protein (TIGR03086 family)
MTTIDLGPAANQLAALVRGVPDDMLEAPTPCPDYRVGDLLDHIGGLSKAFTWAATMEALDMEPVSPTGDASHLGADWRERIPADIEGLAAAWAEPTAWTGMTRAGPVDLPGEIGGLVALDEIVIHGWDVAKATGQPFAVDPTTLQAVHDLVIQFSGPGTEDQRTGGFGPEVEIPAEAPLLDKVLGMVGRRPDWSPPVS